MRLFSKHASVALVLTLSHFQSAFLAPVQRWEKVWVTPETASVPGSAGANGSANGYRVKKWVKVEELSRDQTEQDQAEAALNAAQSTSLNSLAGLQMPGDSTQDASASQSRAQTPSAAPQAPTLSATPSSQGGPPVVPVSQTHPSTFQPQPSQLSQVSQSHEDTEMSAPEPSTSTEAPQPESEPMPVTAPAEDSAEDSKPTTAEQTEEPEKLAEEERIKSVTTALDEGALAQSATDIATTQPAESEALPPTSDS